MPAATNQKRRIHSSRCVPMPTGACPAPFRMRSNTAEWIEAAGLPQEADLPLELAGDNEPPVADLERLLGTRARCESHDDPLNVLRVELRLVARTPEAAHVAVPVRDVAAGMRADAGIRDDAVDGAGARIRCELGRIEPDDDDLVEPRSVPHDAGRRILRIGEDLLRADLEIVGRDRLPGARAERDDEPIVLPRRGGLLTVGRSKTRETDADGNHFEQTSAPAAARGPRNGGLGHRRRRSLRTAAIVRARRRSHNRETETSARPGARDLARPRGGAC